MILLWSLVWFHRLADNIEAEGGLHTMILTHKDDVADHEKWKKRFPQLIRIMHMWEKKKTFVLSHLFVLVLCLSYLFSRCLWLCLCLRLSFSLCLSVSLSYLVGQGRCGAGDAGSGGAVARRRSLVSFRSSVSPPWDRPRDRDRDWERGRHCDFAHTGTHRRLALCPLRRCGVFRGRGRSDTDR